MAIARAIAKRPQVLLCDEPTGALDSKTGVLVLEALTQVNEQLGATTLIITHNVAIQDIAPPRRAFRRRPHRLVQCHRRAQAGLGDQLVMVMSALHRKLLRDLVRLWPQALAIALVMAAGAATLILGIGAYQSLAETRAAYYERNRFADVFADLTRAPKVFEDEIARIPGVAAVETRIAKIALLDLPEWRSRRPPCSCRSPICASRSSICCTCAAGACRCRATSMRSWSASRSPRPTISTSARPSRRSSTAANERLRIVGTALSPEFIYALGPGELMPNDQRFGIVWMREKALAAAYDLTGAFSSVHLKLTRAASEPAVIERLDALLARYGGLGAHGRRDQTSHAFLDAELSQLKAMSRILPPIFLLVAAFLVNMTLSRLILLEREQIGLLKALGYRSVAVGWHYLEFALAIACVGIVDRARRRHLARLRHDAALCRVLSFPVPGLPPRSGDLCHRGGASRWPPRASARCKAVRDVVTLPPAVAMVPPAPAIYRRLLPEAFYKVLRIPQSLIMVTRHLDALAGAHGQQHSRHRAGGVGAGRLAVGVRLDRIHDRRHLSIAPTGRTPPSASCTSGRWRRCSTPLPCPA